MMTWLTLEVMYTFQHQHKYGIKFFVWYPFEYGEVKCNAAIWAIILARDGIEWVKISNIHPNSYTRLAKIFTRLFSKRIYTFASTLSRIMCMLLDESRFPQLRILCNLKYIPFPFPAYFLKLDYVHPFPKYQLNSIGEQLRIMTEMNWFDLFLYILPHVFHPKETTFKKRVLMYKHIVMNLY